MPVESVAGDRTGRTAVALVARALVLLMCAGAAWAQSQQFRHYSGRDGLPQAQVVSLHQDVAGFIWAGTYGGLGRFDGREFVRYTTADGLTTNTVQAIASEADGTVWAGLTRGLCRLPPYQLGFDCPAPAQVGGVHALLVDAGGLWVGAADGLYRLRQDDDGRVTMDHVVSGLAVDALARSDDGKVWIGGRGGLLRLGPDGRREAVVLPAEHGEVRALLAEGGRLWIGTATGLLLRRGNEVVPAPGLPESLRSLGITSLAIGPDGELWASTRLGVLRERDGGFVLLDQGDGLSSNTTYALLRDRTGTLWLGSDGGLSSVLPGAFIGYREAEGLLQSFVRTLAEDHRGRLWLGTRQGVQVIESGPDAAIVQAFTITRSDGMVDDRIYDIVFPAEDEALLATAHGVAHWRAGAGIIALYTDEHGLPSNATRALLTIDDGSVWIGTQGGVVRLLADGRIIGSGYPELDQARVLSIRTDARGQTWFGSLQHGLIRLDRDGALQRWTRNDGLSNEAIWDIRADAVGGVWVGSNGDGLFHIDADDRIHRYTTHDGLADNFVWNVLVDRGGQVWAYTNRGLSRFDGTDFWNYTEDDGLLHPEGSATAALETASGQRWFAAAEGLMHYVGAGRSSRDRDEVTVSLTRVLAGGVPLAPGAVLDAGTGSLELHFSAPVFLRNSDVRYRYRLRGADRDWTELTSARPITLARLGAGHYVFEVQARMAGGDWHEPGAAFGFQVRPALWQTPAFWFVLVIAGAALVLLSVRWRLRQVEARRHALEALVRERTDELQRANERLEEASLTDPLTRLRNRRYLSNQVRNDIAQVRRAYAGPAHFPNRDLIFMMIDIDHFKQINDRHGHGAGDRVLRQYADLIAGIIRESDYAVRWGGEEFLVVARQTEAAQCSVLAERIVERVRETRFAIDDEGTTIRSTCSVGVSHFPFVQAATELFEWSQVLEIADAAVYMVKASGRDGWLAIRGSHARAIGDPVEFMRRVKSEPLALLAEGRLDILGSRLPVIDDPEPAAAGD